MGRYKEREYQPHPLLEELRPRLKLDARKKLEKSILRVGQLQPVLVTADNYILDGRERFDLMTKEGLKPQIRQLLFYSGVDAKALPNAGYSLEDELQSCREVIEETSRGRWRGTEIKSEAKQPTVVSSTDHDTMVSNTNHDAVVSNTSQGTIVSNTNHDIMVSQIAYSLRSLPCDGKAIHLRVPKKLFEHLELMAIKTNASRGKGAQGRQSTGPTAVQYVRGLCWQDYINHLSDADPP